MDEPIERPSHLVPYDSHAPTIAIYAAACAVCMFTLLPWQTRTLPAQLGIEGDGRLTALAAAAVAVLASDAFIGDLANIKGRARTISLSLGMLIAVLGAKNISGVATEAPIGPVGTLIGGVIIVVASIFASPHNIKKRRALDDAASRKFRLRRRTSVDHTPHNPPRPAPRVRTASVYVYFATLAICLLAVLPWNDNPTQLGIDTNGRITAIAAAIVAVLASPAATETRNNRMGRARITSIGLGFLIAVIAAKHVGGIATEAPIGPVGTMFSGVIIIAATAFAGPLTNDETPAS